MISPTKRGRIVELKAESLFLEAGFEVFTNVAADGPADLVVWDGKNFYPIDTKKVQRYVKADESVGYSYSKKMDPDVFYLGHNEQDGWMWLSEPPEALSDLF